MVRKGRKLNARNGPVRNKQAQSDCSMVVRGTIAPGSRIKPVEAAIPDFKYIQVIHCGEIPILYRVSENINNKNHYYYG